MARGAFGDRTRRELHSAAGGPVGLRKDERHLMSRSQQGFERAGGERGRTREDDAQVRPAQAALRCRFLSFARTRFCLSSER